MTGPVVARDTLQVNSEEELCGVDCDLIAGIFVHNIRIANAINFTTDQEINGTSHLRADGAGSHHLANDEVIGDVIFEVVVQILSERVPPFDTLDGTIVEEVSEPIGPPVDEGF